MHRDSIHKSVLNSEWLAQTQYGWQMKNMDGTSNEEWIPDDEYG